MDKSPEVLADRAREVLHRLGHDAPARDSAFSFERDEDYVRYVRDHDSDPGRWKGLSSGRPAALFFWYRQSPELLAPRGPLSVVDLLEPPQTVPGMTTVQLDTRGRLIGFDAEPPEEESRSATSAEPDWSVLFAEAGLEMSQFTPAPPSRVPRVFCDRRMAWEGRFPEAPGVPAHLEAGAYGGRIVAFSIVGPWTRAATPGASAATPRERLAQNLNIALLLSSMVAGIVLARRNLRLGRGDRSGALKIAMYFAAVHILVWALWVDHVPDLSEEWRMFSSDTGWTLFNAALIWLFYLGLEPFVRRRWPGTLISWSRILAGRFRDPLVGRDILLGNLLGAFIRTMAGLTNRLPAWFGWPPAAPSSGNFGSLNGLQWLLGGLIDVHVHTLLGTMQALFLLLLLCALLRKEWIGMGAFILLFSLAISGGGSYPLVGLPLTFVSVGVFSLVLRRLGLLACVVAVFWVGLFDWMPMTADLTSWYAAPTLTALAALAGLAIYGFRVTLAGRPAFGLVSEEAA